MDARQDSSPAGGAANFRWSLTIAAVVVIVLTAAPGRADDDPALIQIYNGVGTPVRACLWGRVLEDKGRAPKKRSSWYRKLKGNIKALESDEIPHAKLTVKVAGRKLKVDAAVAVGIQRRGAVADLPGGEEGGSGAGGRDQRYR